MISSACGSCGRLLRSRTSLANNLAILNRSFCSKVPEASKTASSSTSKSSEETLATKGERSPLAFGQDKDIDVLLQRPRYNEGYLRIYSSNLETRTIRHPIYIQNGLGFTDLANCSDCISQDV